MNKYKSLRLRVALLVVVLCESVFVWVSKNSGNESATFVSIAALFVAVVAVMFIFDWTDPKEFK